MSFHIFHSLVQSFVSSFSFPGLKRLPGAYCILFMSDLVVSACLKTFYFIKLICVHEILSLFHRYTFLYAPVSFVAVLIVYDIGFRKGRS